MNKLLFLKEFHKNEYPLYQKNILLLKRIHLIISSINKGLRIKNKYIYVNKKMGSTPNIQMIIILIEKTPIPSLYEEKCQLIMINKNLNIYNNLSHMIINKI